MYICNVYINTHTCMDIFKKNMLFLNIKCKLYKYIHVNIFNIHIVCVCIYIYITNIHNTQTYII